MAREVVRIDLNGATTPVPDELRPGFFYNNTTQNANRIFDTCRIRANMLRDGDLAWYLLSSSSYEDVMNDVRSLRTLHRHRASKTDRFVTHIAGMPYWLSRSSDTSRVGSNWRYFHTVGPRDYAVWDSLMRDIAAEISTWGYAPYYEFWNEPDLFYWNGTEAEFIGLYRHTADAIKSADPDAKVGGIATNYWYKGIDSQMPTVYGWIPDSLVRRYAAVSHLIDSCSLSGTPLDFISWHMFGGYPYMTDQAAGFFRRQLDSAGMYDTEMYITEYNQSGPLREGPTHPGVMVRYLERAAARGVRHSIAAYQDFETGNSQEFYRGYGMLSRGALCKPAFKALQLANEVCLLGRLLPVDTVVDYRITVLASRQGSRVRVLLANHVYVPLTAGLEALLYSGHRISTEALWAEGYTWATIESVITGVMEPHGPPEIVAAFEDANAAYVWARQGYYTPRTIELRLTGLAGPAVGSMAVLDDSANNIILRYDSLIGAGWTRSAAVAYLYADQDIRRDSLFVPDSVLELALQPNGVVLVDLPDIQTVGLAVQRLSGTRTDLLPLSPNPTRGHVAISYSLARPGSVNLTVFDAAGRRVRALVSAECPAGHHLINWRGDDERGRRVKAGVYYFRFGADGCASTEKLVLQ